MRQIEHRITQQYQQLFMLSSKYPRQRLVISLDHDAFSYPLPELCLRGPKLFTIAADYQGRLLLFNLLLLVFLCLHSSTLCPDTLVPLHGFRLVNESGHTQNPVGKPL